MCEIISLNFNKITVQKKIPEKFVAVQEGPDELKDKITDCHIDIVSACNLSCPTCVQGNMDSIPGGVMSQDLFKKIIIKLKSDFPDLKDIFLYNWTEPFLHNKLPEFVEIVNKADFRCHLSTNLNHIKNLEDMIKNNPYAIRISLSGFTQEVYQKGHRDGNIETVKQNMKILSNLIKKYHASTKVTVNYIKYKHNLSEIPAMKKFALDLGFDIQTFWAFFMGVETTLQYLHTPEKIDKSMMHDLVPLLGREPREFLNLLKPYNKRWCHQLEHQIVLNANGEVQQCCSSLTSPFPFNSKNTYLDLTPEQIYSRRNNAEICKTCMDEGINVIGGSKWDDDELVLHSKIKNKLYKTREKLRSFKKFVSSSV